MEAKKQESHFIRNTCTLRSVTRIIQPANQTAAGQCGEPGQELQASTCTSNIKMREKRFHGNNQRLEEDS